MTRPLEEAVAPPGYYYTSQELFRIEYEEIFLKEWLWVGHVGQVPNPGDFFTFAYEEENIAVVRDKSGKLNAFSSICRHRGALAITGKGNCEFFRCPYHAWIYGLDGKLLSAPEMEAVKNFRRSDYGLVPIKLDTWEGLIFVNFDPHSKPLSASLGDMPERFAKYKLGEQICTHRKVFDFDCNWKVTTENAMDQYHLGGTHATAQKTEYESMQHWHRVENCSGAYDAMIFKGSEAVAQSATSEGGGTIGKVQFVLDGLTEEEERVHHFVLLYPNLMLTFMPDSSGVFVILPDGHERSKVLYDWYYPKELVEQPEFEAIAQAGYTGVSAFIQQDVEVLRLTQKGYRSQRYRPGRLSLYEPLPYENVQYVLSRILGRG